MNLVSWKRVNHMWLMRETHPFVKVVSPFSYHPR